MFKLENYIKDMSDYVNENWEKFFIYNETDFDMSKYFGTSIIPFKKETNEDVYGFVHLLTHKGYFRIIIPAYRVQHIIYKNHTNTKKLSEINKYQSNSIGTYGCAGLILTEKEIYPRTIPKLFYKQNWKEKLRSYIDIKRYYSVDPKLKLYDEIELFLLFIMGVIRTKHALYHRRALQLDESRLQTLLKIIEEECTEQINIEDGKVEELIKEPSSILKEEKNISETLELRVQFLEREVEFLKQLLVLNQKKEVTEDNIDLNFKTMFENATLELTL